MSTSGAGEYLLHVRLRQQATAIPGSPFHLTVLPGPADPRATFISTDAPLSGLVGTDSGGACGCTVRLHTRDKMGNLCVRGGATVTTQAWRGTTFPPSPSDLETVKSSVQVPHAPHMHHRTHAPPPIPPHMHHPTCTCTRTHAAAPIPPHMHHHTCTTTYAPPPPSLNQPHTSTTPPAHMALFGSRQTSLAPRRVPLTSHGTIHIPHPCVRPHTYPIRVRPHTDMYMHVHVCVCICSRLLALRTMTTAASGSSGSLSTPATSPRVCSSMVSTSKAHRRPSLSSPLCLSFRRPCSKGRGLIRLSPGPPQPYGSSLSTCTRTRGSHSGHALARHRLHSSH
jgi:hypothetical protein